MIKASGRGIGGIRYGPERLGTAGAVAASAGGWLLALGGLAGAISVLPETV